MTSFLEQYEKREGVYANVPPPEKKPEPKKKGFLAGVAEKVGLVKPAPTPAPTPQPAVKAKPVPFLEQYENRVGIFATTKGEPKLETTPEEEKKAAFAAFMDDSNPTVRSIGTELRKTDMQTPKSPLLKMRIPAAEQSRLDDPQAATQYVASVKAQEPDSLVQKLKNAYKTYSDSIDRISMNVALGELGTVESFLGAVQWVAPKVKELPVPLVPGGASVPVENATEAVGQAAGDRAERLGKWMEAAQETMEDPTFVDQLAQGVGSSAVFFLPGMGVARGSSMLATVSPKVAKLFGGSASAALEAMAEAGNVYRSTLTEKGRGGNPEQVDEDASNAATKTFWANVVLVSLTNRFGVFNPDTAGFVRRMVMSSPIEGVQEAAQQIISNFTTEKEDLLEGTGSSFLIGAIVGGVMGAGVETLDQVSGTAGIQGDQNILPTGSAPEQEPVTPVQVPEISPEEAVVPETAETTQQAPNALDELVLKAREQGKTYEQFLKDVEDSSNLEDTVQFHGTQQGEALRAAAESGTVRVSESGVLGRGFYLTPTPELAKYFGQQTARPDQNGRTMDTSVTPDIVAVDLRGLNIKTEPFGKQEYYDFLEKEGYSSPDAYSQKLAAEGYDGLNLEGRGETIIFDPGKVKLIDLEQYYTGERKTQRQQVEEVVAGMEGPASIGDVKSQLPGLPEPTIRRILGTGAKDGTFERVAKGVYVLKKDGKNVAYVETANAVEALPRLADEGFKADMIFLDIPYDTPAVKGGNRGAKYELISVDDFKKVLAAVKVIARTPDTPVVHMYSQAASGLKAMSKYNDAFLEFGFVPVGKGEYQKTYADGSPVAFPTPSGSKVTPPEGLLVFTQSGNTAKELGDLNFKMVRPKGYQTEKPAQLLKELIEMTTKEGDTVLDPFAGSGVTGAEAVKAGREAYLIEKNADVVETITKPRVETAAREAVTPKETLVVKSEDLDKLYEVELERISRAKGETKETRAAARATVKEKVSVKGETVARPEMIVTKTALRDVVAASKNDYIDFEVTSHRFEKYLTATVDRTTMRIKAKALGFVEENLKVGDIVRVSLDELSKKGRSLRVHNSAGALAFNIKNFEQGALSPQGVVEGDKIVQRSEIARELATKLGVPVRTGHFKNQALGIFKPWAHVIRLKNKLGDMRIPVLVHESGHYIDATLLGKPVKTPQGMSWSSSKFVSNLIPRSELDPLLQEYGGTPGSYPKKKEAFAEFIRYWVTEPQKATARAPQFTRIWEEEILPQFPEVRDTLQTTRTDWQRWKEAPAVAKLVSQISFGERATTWEDVKEGTVRAWHDTLSKWTDDLHPIKQFSDLAKARGVNFKLEDDPYILARLSRGWVGKASTFLEKGTFDVRFWKENAEGKAEPVFTGKGFAEIIAPVVSKGATEDLAAYLVARRAKGLNAREIHSGITTEVATQAFSELEQKYPEFEQVAADLDAYQDALLQYVQRSGLMSTEVYQKIKAMSKDYVPFYRVMEEAESKGLAGRTLADLRNPVKKIKGSDRDVINPLESIVKNTYALMNAAERNRVGISMVNLSSKHPELAQLFEAVPTEQTKVASVKINDLIEQVAGGKLGLATNMRAGLAQQALGGMGEEIVNIFRPSFFQDDNILTVMIQGKPKSFYADTEIYKAMQGMEAEDISLVWKLLSYPARWLRAGATLTPEFMVRNPARDMMSAYVYSEYGFMPPVDMPRGLYGAFTKDSDYWLWRMGGGEQSMLTSMDRTTLKKTYQDLAAEHNLKSTKGVIHLLGRYKNPIESLRLFSEFSEKMTRVGAAKKAIARGANPLEAAFEAREVTLDFAKIGSKARAVNMIVAFFNAQIQGSVRMVRAFQERPYATTAKTMLGITLPSVILALWNAQEPDWEEIPQWQKNLFWMLKVGDTWYRFPKPFELGILFGSIPERVIESIQYNDKELFAELRKAVMDGATPSLLPTSLLPIIENTTNHSFFLNRSIVPDSLETLPAFAQYTSYTSETAKTIGKWLSYSPAKIDNLINGYFAGLGRYATHLIDKATALAQGKEAVEKPAPTLSDIPVIKAFVVRDPVSSSSESLSRFYTKAETAFAAKTYHKDLIEKGNMQEAEEWYADHSAEIALSAYYEKTRTSIATLRRLQNMARDSKELTPEQKRERMDEIGTMMTELAQKAISIKLKDAEYE